MATRKKDDVTNINLPALGEKGETCAECSAALATDQRYCLNCGERRTGPRLDFERLLPGVAIAGGGPATAQAAQAAPMMAVAAPRNEWSPLVAVGCIAVLGGMLLLGVLIGNDKNATTVAAAPTATATTPAATTAAAPTTTEAAPTEAPKKAGAGANAAVAGGSGSTDGIAPATTLGKTGKDLVDASKNSPDVVATQGTPEKLDPNGQPGNGSGATCIGGC